MDDSLLDVKYSKFDYYAQIGEKVKCKKLSLEIVEELKKLGLDIEAQGEEKRLTQIINKIE